MTLNSPLSLTSTWLKFPLSRVAGRGGDTPEETIETLQSVASAFIDIYEENGEELTPP